eukprot:jgi/Botrbrau1/22061/Bobra.0024s0070.1
MASDLDFPWFSENAVQEPAYSFRANIESLVRNHGHLIELPEFPGLTAWVIPLKSSSGTTRLHIYKEQVINDEPAVCDQCRIIGWQHHFVCNARYHFILPAVKGPKSLASPQYLPSFVEAKFDGKNLVVPTLSAEQESHSSLFTAPASVVESHTHLLHGVVHINGFGHLLRINGLEGGSVHVTGRQIMELWDRLCSFLRARKITVEDVSNKSGMELRVLHAVAFQKTWYGRWGYTYGRGGFNISRQIWKKAMGALSAVTVASVRDNAVTDETLGKIISRCQEGGASSQECLGAFLKRMLGYLAKPVLAAKVLGLSDWKPPMPQPQPGGQVLLEAPPKKAAAPASSNTESKKARSSGPKKQAPADASPALVVVKKSRTERLRTRAPQGPLQVDSSAESDEKALRQEGDLDKEADMSAKPLPPSNGSTVETGMHRKALQQSEDFEQETPADGTGLQQAECLEDSELAGNVSPQLQYPRTKAEVSEKAPLHTEAPEKQADRDEVALPHFEAPEMETGVSEKPLPQAEALQREGKGGCETVVQRNKLKRKPTSDGLVHCLSKKAKSKAQQPKLEMHDWDEPGYSDVPIEMEVDTDATASNQGNKPVGGRGPVGPGKPGLTKETMLETDAWAAGSGASLPAFDMRSCKGKGKWSNTRCQTLLNVILAELKLRQGIWTSRVALRASVQKQAQLDAGLVDFMLKIISNTTIGDCNIYRQKLENEKGLHYKLVELRSGDPGAGPSGEVPQDGSASKVTNVPPPSKASHAASNRARGRSSKANSLKGTPKPGPTSVAEQGPNPDAVASTQAHVQPDVGPAAGRESAERKLTGGDSDVKSDEAHRHGDAIPPSVPVKQEVVSHVRDPSGARSGDALSKPEQNADEVYRPTGAIVDGSSEAAGGWEVVEGAGGVRQTGEGIGGSVEQGRDGLDIPLQLAHEPEDVLQQMDGESSLPQPIAALEEADQPCPAKNQSQRIIDESGLTQGQRASDAEPLLACDPASTRNEVKDEEPPTGVKGSEQHPLAGGYHQPASVLEGRESPTPAAGSPCAQGSRAELEPHQAVMPCGGQVPNGPLEEAVDLSDPPIVRGEQDARLPDKPLQKESVTEEQGESHGKGSKIAGSNGGLGECRGTSKTVGSPSKSRVRGKERGASSNASPTKAAPAHQVPGRDRKPKNHVNSANASEPPAAEEGQMGPDLEDHAFLPSNTRGYPHVGHSMDSDAGCCSGIGMGENGFAQEGRQTRSLRSRTVPVQEPAPNPPAAESVNGVPQGKPSPQAYQMPPATAPAACPLMSSSFQPAAHDAKTADSPTGGPARCGLLDSQSSLDLFRSLQANGPREEPMATDTELDFLRSDSIWDDICTDVPSTADAHASRGLEASNAARGHPSRDSEANNAAQGHPSGGPKASNAAQGHPSGGFEASNAAGTAASPVTGPTKLKAAGKAPLPLEAGEAVFQATPAPDCTCGASGPPGSDAGGASRDVGGTAPRDDASWAQDTEPAATVQPASNGNALVGSDAADGHEAVAGGLSLATAEAAGGANGTIFTSGGPQDAQQGEAAAAKASPPAMPGRGVEGHEDPPQRDDVDPTVSRRGVSNAHVQANQRGSCDERREAEGVLEKGSVGAGAVYRESDFNGSLAPGEVLSTATGNCNGGIDVVQTAVQGPEATGDELPGPRPAPGAAPGTGGGDHAGGYEGSGPAIQGQAAPAAVDMEMPPESHQPDSGDPGKCSQAEGDIKDGGEPREHLQEPASSRGETQAPAVSEEPPPVGGTQGAVAEAPPEQELEDQGGALVPPPHLQRGLHASDALQAGGVLKAPCQLAGAGGAEREGPVADPASNTNLLLAFTVQDIPSLEATGEVLSPSTEDGADPVRHPFAKTVVDTRADPEAAADGVDATPAAPTEAHDLWEDDADGGGGINKAPDHRSRSGRILRTPKGPLGSHPETSKPMASSSLTSVAELDPSKALSDEGDGKPPVNSWAPNSPAVPPSADAIAAKGGDAGSGPEIVQWGNKASRSRGGGVTIHQSPASPGPASVLTPHQAPGGLSVPAALPAPVPSWNAKKKSMKRKSHKAKGSGKANNQERLGEDLVQIGWKRDHKRGGGLLAVFAPKGSPEALAVKGIPIGDLPRVDIIRKSEPQPAGGSRDVPTGVTTVPPKAFRPDVILPAGAKRIRSPTVPLNGEEFEPVPLNAISKKSRTHRPAGGGMPPPAAPALLPSKDDAHARASLDVATQGAAPMRETAVRDILGNSVAALSLDAGSDAAALDAEVPGDAAPSVNGEPQKVPAKQGKQKQSSSTSGTSVKRKRPAGTLPGADSQLAIKPGLLVRGSSSRGSKAVWELLTPGGDLDLESGGNPRDQILCDLVYFFKHVLAVPPVGHVQQAMLAGMLADKSKKVVGQKSFSSVQQQCTVLAQTLRDVKHHVKAYEGELSCVGHLKKWQEVKVPGMFYAMCQVDVPPEEPPEELPGKRVLPQHRVHENPPAELIVVPIGASLQAFKEAVVAAYRELYYAFRDFKVDEMSGIAVVGSKLKVTAPSGVVLVSGHGIDFSPQWRHAGGEEDWVVNCRCGTRDDDGERMFECEFCKQWSHTRCAGYADDVVDLPNYVCPRCSKMPTDRRRKLLESLASG